MGKRCSLGLFCFVLFIVVDPAYSAQSEAVTERLRPNEVGVITR